jgi:predicted nucleic acid-binding protein
MRRSFQIEVTNALHVCTIKGRIVDTQALLNALMLQLPLLHDSAPLLPRALEIATLARRSVYDSLYIALAEREGCELVTADQRLYNSVKSQFPFVVDLASL